MKRSAIHPNDDRHALRKNMLERTFVTLHSVAKAIVVHLSASVEVQEVAVVVVAVLGYTNQLAAIQPQYRAVDKARCRLNIIVATMANHLVQWRLPQ